MTFEWSEPPTGYNLARPTHCVWLANELKRKYRHGLRAADRKLIRQALDACAFHGYPPPRELVELAALALKVPFDGKKRGGVQDMELFRTAARLKAETGLKGRTLARELRSRGLNISDRTINSGRRSATGKRKVQADGQFLSLTSSISFDTSAAIRINRQTRSSKNLWMSGRPSFT